MYVDVDVELGAQADASMPAPNNNVDFRFREVLLGNHKSYLHVAKIYQVAI